MELIDMYLDEIIEGLEKTIMDLEQGTKEYDAATKQLDILLTHRERQFKNEADAVASTERLEFEKKKFEEESAINKGRLEFDKRKFEQEIEDRRDKNEADIEAMNKRLEFENKKLKQEASNNKSRQIIDIVGHIVRLGCTITTCATAGLAVFGGYKLEYDSHNPLNIPSNIWSFIPKLKP